MRSHRVNAGNDLGGQLGHDDHDDAGQQSGLQQKGLRVKLASWGVKPGRIRELGKGIRRRLFRGLLSTWQRRRPGTQQRPLWHCKEQEDDVSNDDGGENNLATQEESFDVVSLGGNLTKPACCMN